jgi:hypothetical protein
MARVISARHLVLGSPSRRSSQTHAEARTKRALRSHKRRRTSATGHARSLIANAIGAANATCVADKIDLLRTESAIQRICLSEVAP